MHVEYAQLPPPEDSADRIFITDNAVIVLDGATAFEPVPVSAQTYATHLGQRLVERLIDLAEADLQRALADAILQTATDLKLKPGNSPSSTVSILRARPEFCDFLVLGDSPLLWGARGEAWSLTDNRLSQIASTQRERYKSRLRAGYGFDEQHQQLLRTLQAAQRAQRNKAGGYWIAEAAPAAASNAYVTTIPRAGVEWAILATDGAFDGLEHQGREDWFNIAAYSSERLVQLLQRWQAWEANSDSNGQRHPRAKIHDDKAIAAVRFHPN